MDSHSEVQDAEKPLDSGHSLPDLDDCTGYEVKYYAESKHHISQLIIISDDGLLEAYKDTLILLYTHIRTICIGKREKVELDDNSLFHFTIFHEDDHGLRGLDFSVSSKQDRYQILLKIMGKLPDTTLNTKCRNMITECYEYQGNAKVFEIDPVPIEVFEDDEENVMNGFEDAPSIPDDAISPITDDVDDVTQRFEEPHYDQQNPHDDQGSAVDHAVEELKAEIEDLKRQLAEQKAAHELCKQKISKKKAARDQCEITTVITLRCLL